MPLKYNEIKALVDELAPRLEGGWIQKVFEPRTQKHTWVLQLRLPGETIYPVFSDDRDYGRIVITESKPEQPATPGAFTMLLRKWLPGWTIESLSLAENDRIVRISLRRDGNAALALVLELTGKNPALVLLQDGVVLGTTRNDSRLRVGEHYTPPTPPDSLGEPTTNRFEDDMVSRITDWANNGVLERDESMSRTRVESALNAAIRRTRRLERNIEADLAKAEDAESYRIYGELLQSAYGKVPAGATVARVPNYYDENLAELEIPLDASRSLQSNIERYFHAYRRLKDAKNTIEERLFATIEKLEKLERARERAKTLSESAQFDAFYEDLLRKKLIRAKQAAPHRRESVERKPYREFRARSGTPIFVGRGSKDNDRLTFKVARGRDIWLHARDWAGSHVILRVQKNSAPSSEDILDAAILAAHFSKGKNDSIVDVMHTPTKYVRKPKGAKPGQVTVADASNIAVNQEPARLERLKNSFVPDA